jgi:hypothetical protein
MRAPCLAEAANQRRSAGFEKDEPRIDPRHRLELTVHDREALEKPALAYIDDDRDALEAGIVAAGELGEGRE